MKRNLTDKEVELNKKGIDRLKQRNERLRYFMEYLNLDLKKLKLDYDVGYKMKLEMKIEEMEKELLQMSEEIKSNESQMIILKNQIKGGVETKSG